MEQLLSTKFYIPPTRPKFVSRPRLIERINEGLDRKLTLVSAPAGFGKTTLISDWIENFRNNLQDLDNPEREIAWLTLDENDDDPVRFLMYFIAALRHADGINPNFGEGVLSMLQSPQPSSIESSRIALINEIAARPRRIILVLDDFHLIESSNVIDNLSFILEKLPPQFHLIIISREEPNLPLSRLRARDQMNEIGAAELRFNSFESLDYFQRVLGITLSEQDIKALDSRTEGWITGLQMAGVHMEGHEDPTELIKEFTGSHRLVMDYLLEEVLEKQSEDMQRFLLQTAILNRLSAPLCDALTGKSDSQEVLNSLDQANLFIIPLDGERRWYRYHHLFKDLLYQRLQSIQPDAMGNLQLKASSWYQNNGFFSEAIEHALVAGDSEYLANLIKINLDAIWQHGDHLKLERWLKAIPNNVLASSSRLSVLYAWNLFVRGYPNLADQYLAAAEEVLKISRGPSSSLPKVDQKAFSDEEMNKLWGKYFSIRALMASYRGDADNIILYARNALDYLPKHELAWRLACIIALGDAHSFDGDPAAAYKVRLEAQEMSSNSGNAYLMMLTSQRLAITLLQQGHLPKVIDICQRYVKFASENGIAQSDIAGWLLAIWGEALAEVNEMNDALSKVEKGVELTEQGGDVMLIIWTRLCLVRVLFTRGEVSDAEKVLQKVENLSMEYDCPLWITSHISYLKIRLLLANDKIELASNWAETSGLSINQIPPRLREIEYMGLVRILLAQDKLDETDQLFDYLIEITEGKGHILRLIEILIIQSLVYEARGKTDQAISILEKAISKAEPGGFIRLFVDEGPPLARLLYEAYNRGIAQEYISTLLAAFLIPEFQHPVFKRRIHLGTELITPLTDREIEILQLISEGLTNKEIASRLYLSLSTVKVHNMHIYEKLNVSNRREAVIRAKVLGILSSV